MNVSTPHLNQAITSSMQSRFDPANRESPVAQAGAFASDLQRAQSKHDLEVVRESVEQLVASSLVLPALQTLRESNLSAEPFAPGTAEKRFGPILDQHLADEVTKSANFPLIDSMVDRLAREYGLPAQASTNATREARHG